MSMRGGGGNGGWERGAPLGGEITLVAEEEGEGEWEREAGSIR